ncbi:MAG: hypothetical protein ACR2QK_04195 [Acidimicrobiales bacterium]
MVDGRLLIEYAEAVVRAGDSVAELRARLLDRVGPEATAHAAATITAFSGLVRVADGTGIPIDDGLAAVSAPIRDELALEKLGGAANSKVDGIDRADFTTVGALFDNS